MSIEEVQIENLRRIESLQLQPGPRWNWILGANGVGKSTVLEGIHLLATGQSWRRGQRQLIREGSTAYQLRLRYAATGCSAQIAMRRCGEEREMLHDGERLQSAWQLLDILPLQAWHEGNGQFVSGSAEDRRRILDWGLYYTKRNYGTLLRSYRHALKQRNAALRLGQSPRPWNRALAELGEAIQEQRDQHLQAVSQHFGRIWQHSPQGEIPVQFDLYRGWTEDLLGALERDEATDRQWGYTHSGSHRARLQFRVQGRPAAEQLSRGQLRLLGIAFRLAQLAVQRVEGARLPVILIDDFSAELDDAAKAWWMGELDTMATQIFAATTEAIPPMAGAIQFHLAAGRLHKEVRP